MKNKVMNIIFSVFLGMVCIFTAMGQTVIDLDQAMLNAARQIDGQLSAGATIALVNLESPTQGFSQHVLDGIASHLNASRKVSVINQRDVATYRTSKNININQRSADNVLSAVGFYPWQFVATGSLAEDGNSYRLTVRVLRTPSGALVTQYAANIANNAKVQELLGRTAVATSAPAQTPAPARPAPTPAVTTTVYNIGDTGPAGGIIFYDKGNNNGGWRYLEAAPVEAEFNNTSWSVRNTKVESLQETIGNGRRNTQLIVEALSRVSGEWDTAAQRCNDLNFGGFNDWFLPSRAELDQMYGQLKRRNLGDFKDGWYWSSSVDRDNDALIQNFNDGRLSYSNKNSRHYVRPIRQVAGQ